MNYQDIITIEPGKGSGKPCIRGMRIAVYDVLEYLASDMSQREILDDFSDLSVLQNFPSKEGFGQPSSSSDQADLRRRHTSARDTISPEVHNAANSRSYY